MLIKWHVVVSSEACQRETFLYIRFSGPIYILSLVSCGGGGGRHGRRRRSNNNRRNTCGNNMRVLIQELMENPSGLGQDVILPGLLCLLASGLEENLGGVEAVHVPFPHALKAVNLLELPLGEGAVVGFEGSNGSLEEALFGPLIGSVGFGSEKIMKLGYANGLSYP